MSSLLPQFLKNKQFIFLLVSWMFFLITFTLLLTEKSYALTLNPDPGRGVGVPNTEYDYLKNCDSGANSPAVTTWLSPVGRPASLPTVTVTYGTPSVDFQANFSGAICFGNVNGAHVTNSRVTRIITPGTTFPNGRDLRLDWRPSSRVAGTYRNDTLLVRYSPRGGFTTSGLYSVFVETRAVNTFPVSPLYRCVQNGVPPSTSGPTNYSPCAPLNLEYKFQVNVTNIPTDARVNTTTSCTTISGWAIDRDVPRAQLMVEVYMNRPRGTSGAVRITPAGPPAGVRANDPTPRISGVAWVPAAELGRHGFNIGIAGRISAGTSRRFYIYIWGVDISGRQVRVPLSISRTITCPASGSYSLSVDANAISVNLDDEEDPSEATFNSDCRLSITPTASVTINSVQIQRNYYYVQSGVSTPLSTDNRTANVTTNATGTYDCGNPAPTIPLPSGLSAGDTVCETITVSPGGGNGTVSSGVLTIPSPAPASVTDNTCTPVVNKPYISVLGNDVFAGTSADSWFGPPTASGVYGFARGSTGTEVQIGILALGPIDTSNVLAKQKFADTPCCGNFGAIHVPPNYDPPAGISSTDMSSIPSNGKYTYTPNSIGGITIPVGTRLVLYVSGNITITDFISYSNSGSWGSISQIPSLTIVATGNITIYNKATNIDAVLVSEGTIFTCEESIKNNLFANCNNQLTVNGALISKSIKWRRTSGSLRGGGPAEVINYTPEVYMGGSTPSGGIETQSITSLPPIL
jgi:hypothetical protein